MHAVLERERERKREGGKRRDKRAKER